MRYSDVKVEKLLAFPKEPQPNQFYLIETRGITRFYLSDTFARLHLLNETPALVIKDVNGLTLVPLDSGSIITDKASIGYQEITLPTATLPMDFEFWCFHGNGIRVSTSVEGELIYFEALSGPTIESTTPVSTIKLASYEGHWVVRYFTGAWEFTGLLLNDLDEILTADGGAPLYA